MRYSRFERVLAIGLAALGISFTLAPMQAQAQTGTTCRDLHIPVSVALLLPATMYGKLCVPAGPANVVQVLIPGGTYNSTYWDPPVTPGVHSFRKAMNAAGFATLTVDRLGTGRSSVPLGAGLTALDQARVMHQVVLKLRSGAFGPRFGKVIIGGHSLGSTISIFTAANHGDVDGVLVTGLAHRIDPVNVAKGFASFQPAMLDPKFLGKILDPTYLTTQPGTRKSIFHDPGDVLPTAVAMDESTKDVFAATEAVDGIGVAIVTPYSRLVRVPVMLALGGHDSLFCSPLALDCTSAETVRRSESLYYSPAARLRTYLLPGSYGHSFNYAPNAGEYHHAVVQWADSMIGR